MSSNSSLQVTCSGLSPSGSRTAVVIALCYGVLIPLIVLGNGLVVASFIINHRLRTATNIFICGLGLSDLLIGVFSVPYWTYISTLNSLMDAFCTPLYNVYICVDIGTGCASILQLTSIAIERLYFTVAPLKHRRLPRSVYWYMLAIAWIFSIFAAGLQPLQHKAEWFDEYSIFLMVTCFIFPLIIIVAVYLYILKVGRDHSRKRPSTQSRMGSSGTNIKEFNIFVTVIVITGVFVVAWAPFFVTTVIFNFCPTCFKRPQSDHLVRFVKWMQYSSSAINPYIYAYRNEDVRNSFKKIIRAVFCFCCKSENQMKSGTFSRRQTYENNNGYSNSKDDNVLAERADLHNELPRILDVNGVSHSEQTSRTAQLEVSDLKDTETVLTKAQEQCFNKSNNGFENSHLQLQLRNQDNESARNNWRNSDEIEGSFRSKEEINSRNSRNANRLRSQSTLDAKSQQTNQIKDSLKNEGQSQKNREKERYLDNEKEIKTKGQNRRQRSQSTFEPRSLSTKETQHEFKHGDLQRKHKQKSRHLEDKEKEINNTSREKRQRSHSTLEPRSLSTKEKQHKLKHGDLQRKNEQNSRHLDKEKEINNTSREKIHRQRSHSTLGPTESNPSRHKNSETSNSIGPPVPSFDNPVNVVSDSEGTYV